MKLFVECSRLANKYFFINNLAEANPYIRKRYNEAYLAVIGELNEEQKTALAKYRNWYQELNSKNEKERKRIIRIFYHSRSENEAWQEYAAAEGIETVKAVFESLDGPFEAIWQKFESTLKQAKERMDADFLKREGLFAQIFKELGIFYGVLPPEKIAASLIICPIPRYQGGKSIDASTVSLEVPKMKTEDSLMRLWLLFVHEVIHAHFETNQYKEWLRNFVEKKIKEGASSLQITEAKNQLREIITSSLAARGYIAERFFGVDIIAESKRAFKNPQKYTLSTGEHQENLRHWTRLELRGALHQYFERGRKIDENFLQKGWETLVKYETAVR